MINITVSYGSGDRKAPVVSDSLIPDQATAMIRAKQLLAEYTYIVLDRTLSLPHDPDGGVGGASTEEFVYQPLEVYGTHRVVSRTINLSPTEAKDEVKIEQYREMVL